MPRGDRVDIKNEKNRAKTTKIRLVEDARTKLKRTLKNLGLNVTKGPNCKESTTAGGYFCKIRKAQRFSAKMRGPAGLTSIDPADLI
jgi:hypothetical protein